MTTNPHKPCSICGKLLWTTATSLPNPVCLACRRKLRQCLCWQCGKQFDSPGGQGKFCSKQCFRDSRPVYDRAAARKANVRARKLNKNKTWDGVPDRDIYERAGGMCQLGSWCRAAGMPIDPNAPKTNELAPNIDHIIPLSLGGIDVSANKRAAHQICNVKRGNQMNAEETAFMDAHPELLLAKAQFDAIPRRSRVKKPPKPPRPTRICACEGCETVGSSAICPDCRVAVNRHRAQQHYYVKRGLTPPDPWWVTDGIAQHQAHA